MLKGVLLAIFFGTVAFFSRFDVFNQNFDTSGLPLLAYNLCRVLFLFYFVWILCGLGILVLEYVRKRRIEFGLSVLDRLILSFYLGGAVLTAVMFALGYLNFYYKATALVLAAAILFISYSPLGAALAEWISHLRRRLPEIGFVGYLLMTAALLLAGHLLLSRCLYPGSCSNDVYEHYLPFHKAVLKNHGIWPNDVWENFYNAKGMGLAFFSELLTDLFAAQSVSYCFLLASTLALYSLAKKVFEDSLWAGLAVVAYLGCFPFSNKLGWGAFQSHHIQMASMLVGITWLVSLPIPSASPSKSRTAWLAISILPIIGSVIAFPDYLAFTLPLLSGLCVWFRVRRDKETSRHFLMMGLSAVATMVLIFTTNYFVSGWMSIDPLGFWKFANQRVFSKWCSAYLVVWFMGVHSTAVSLHWPSIFALSANEWAKVLRLNVLRGLFAGRKIMAALALILISSRLFPSRKRLPDVRKTLSLLIPSVIICIGTLFLIAVQYAPPSTFRNVTFMCFFLALMGTLFWKFAIELLIPARLYGIAASIFILVSASVSVANAWTRNSAKTPAFKDYLGFAAGKLSVHSALALGDGILEYSLEAKKAVGIEAKIFFPHNDGNVVGASYFIPGSGLITEPSNSSFGGKWHVIAFGTEEQAIEELKKLGINYILVDLKSGFMGSIPFGPIFEPTKMTQRFDVVWNKGSAYLLTWRGQGKMPLPQFVADAIGARRLAAKRGDSQDPRDIQMATLYVYMKKLYDENGGRDYPVLPRKK